MCISVLGQIGAVRLDFEKVVYVDPPRCLATSRESETSFSDQDCLAIFPTCLCLADFRGSNALREGCTATCDAATLSRDRHWQLFHSETSFLETDFKRGNATPSAAFFFCMADLIALVCAFRAELN